MKPILYTIVCVFLTFNLLAQNSDSSKFYFSKGVEEKTARRFLVASKYFEKAISFNPKNTKALVESGKNNLEMRRIDAALGDFTKAYELEPTNQEVITPLVELYFNNRQFQKALDLVQQCKTCKETDRFSGMAYYQLEDYGKAVALLQKAITVNPADAEAYYTLGKTFIELDDYKKAIVPYQKAIELDTSKNIWMYELGLIYYNNYQYSDAIKYFKMAEENGYQKSNDFYENAGFSYLSMGDMPSGMAYLNKVLERKPNNKELLSGIAQALHRAKKYDEALTYYQKLIELDSMDANALYMAGITFIKKGQKEKGQAMCDKAIQMDPSLAKNRTKTGEQFGL
jgi:tetratricopeptide (TPR) repeat protein